MRFQGQVAIVTGGASGIGKACCERFIKEGAKIAIADLNQDHGLKAVAEIEKQGGEAVFFRCDVGKPEDLQNLILKTMEKWNRLDVIVNNAAIMTFGSLVDITIEQWDRVIETNLRSTFLLCKYGIPHIRNGAIVNISSVHAHETTPNNSPYAASKGGIEALTRALSLELDPDHCRVNCVAPGAVNTPMLWSNPNVKSGKEKITGKIAEPEDIAAAVAFLASKEARFIHGTTLVVDNGRLDIL